MLHPSQKIFVAGAGGMVGSASVRLLQKRGFSNLLAPRHAELDLTDQRAVKDYLQQHKPDLIVIAAAKVGGIFANKTYPADFLYENLMIASNLIHQAHLTDIQRLMFLGSSCIYPRLAPQPIPESALLTSSLEPTNEGYALAKIAGVKLCRFYSEQYGRQYISAMPTNLYGPGDNYHPENSHVIPGLIRRIHEAKQAGAPEVVIWGSGTPLREFLHVDDLAEAILFLLDRYDEAETINVGSSDELSIRALAELIAAVVGYRGRIAHDLSKPDGPPRKKTDTSRLNALGWAPKIPLREGLEGSYADFLKRLT